MPRHEHRIAESIWADSDHSKYVPRTGPCPKQDDYSLSFVTKLVIAILFVIALIALWKTNPERIDPQCKGKSVVRACVQ